jgi:hypothetical protein
MAKQETALVTQGSNELVKAEVATFTGLDLLSGFKEDGPILGLDISPSDIKLPRFRLMQPTSLEVTQQKVSAGTFYNAVTGEAVKELPCTLLIKNTSRVMWDKVFKRGDKPLCRSFDAVRSADSRRECAKCPDSRWDNKSDSDSKPACNMSYGWLALSKLESSMNQPFRIIIPGKSVTYTKDFLTQITPKRLPPFAFKVTLVPEFMQNEKGAFYVIKYRQDGNLAEDLLKSLGWTEQEVKADPEKAKVFTTQMKTIWDQYKDMVKSYEELFKQTIEMDMEETPIVIDDAPITEGALF